MVREKVCFIKHSYFCIAENFVGKTFLPMKTGGKNFLLIKNFIYSNNYKLLTVWDDHCSLTFEVFL